MTRKTQAIFYVIRLCDKKTKDNVKQNPHPHPHLAGSVPRRKWFTLKSSIASYFILIIPKQLRVTSKKLAEHISHF